MPASPAPRTNVPELTLKAVLAGLVFGVLFGAANAYLGLKSGLTVTTSIPIAVLSAAVFRGLSKNGGTILEANLAQTIGSASSSLASGTIFTIPALFMWGVVPTVAQVAMLAFLGGVLGVLAMVPLRRLLIVQADAELPYPEGRACAVVLRATESGGSGGRWILAGIVLGAAVELALSAAHVLPKEIVAPLGFLPNARLAIKVSPALLAVGYIVGFRASSVMVAGSLISALVLVPLATKAHMLGAEASGGAMLGPGEIRTRFITFIGAGAVAAAAIVTIVRTAPTMVKSLAAVWSGLRRGSGSAKDDRLDRDLPGWVLIAGLFLLVVALATIPDLFAGDLPLRGRIFAALGVAVFGFVFVPVSSRLVGIIGVSSNPTSAMALITLAGTSSVFLLLGWRDLEARAAVLTVGTVVCVAASKAGDISQDLKTGWLVGATPLRQQACQLLAAAVACWAIALVVVAIGMSPEGFGPDDAPQARLMKTVVEAVLGAALPWDLLATGAGLSLVGTLAGLPALPFALGIYLPLSTMAAIFLGGVVRRLVESRKKEASAGSDSGILCASGFVAGEGLAGVGIAGLAFATGAKRYVAPPASALELALAMVLLLGIAAVLFRSGRTSQ